MKKIEQRYEEVCLNEWAWLKIIHIQINNKNINNKNSINNDNNIYNNNTLTIIITIFTIIITLNKNGYSN